MISVALKQFREPLEEAYRQRRTNDLKQDPINVDPLRGLFTKTILRISFK